MAQIIRKNLANIITSIRIIGALSLIFFKPLSIPFFIIYGICGLSDAFDGFVARKLGISSPLGSALDSISDLLFYGIMAAKIFPILVDNLTVLEWVIIAVPTGLHFVAYILCAIKFNKFSAIHTYADKALGLFVYAFPFFLIGLVPLVYGIYMYIGGVFALYSAVELNLIHLIAKRYDEKNKSIFLLKRNQSQDVSYLEKLKSLLNKEVTIYIDRPIGTVHPLHPSLKYEVNYGHIKDLKAPDNEEQDVYVLDINEPINECTSKVIAIIHRLNDNEDKLVAANKDYSNEEIEKLVAFQEQYFKHTIIR